MRTVTCGSQRTTVETVAPGRRGVSGLVAESRRDGIRGGRAAATDASVSRCSNHPFRHWFGENGCAHDRLAKPDPWGTARDAGLQGARQAQNGRQYDATSRIDHTARCHGRHLSACRLCFPGPLVFQANPRWFQQSRQDVFRRGIHTCKRPAFNLLVSHTRFRSCEGTKVHGRVCRFRGVTGSRPPVVLVSTRSPAFVSQRTSFRWGT
jgi:hypothetical protein